MADAVASGSSSEEKRTLRRIDELVRRGLVAERDAALLEIARDAATVLVEHHPALAAEHIRRWLGTKAALLDA